MTTQPTTPQMKAARAQALQASAHRAAPTGGAAERPVDVHNAERPVDVHVAATHPAATHPAATQNAARSTMELLAPAGNMECLHAALRAGADAVYLGLDKFNARRNAANFTRDNLTEACTFAHLRGARVYATMNVEILPSELDEALDYARAAAAAGCDGLIMQDVGLMHEVRRALPELPIHLSTQVNIHNEAGIELAAVLGAARVTLARELSLEEVAHLAAVADDFGIEVECFGHGALCVCYSGQCLMSSLIGGRSANRGVCAQACRLPYELWREGSSKPLPAEGEHLLSPRDLCTIDLLGELDAAGITSLKIEGRMKSPEYVFEVVSVYREALDELVAGATGAAGAAGTTDTAAASANAATSAASVSTNADANTDAATSTPAANPNTSATTRHDALQDARRARLAEAFSRGFTTAYLTGKRGNDIMSYTRPNNRGVAIGRVSSYEHGCVHFRTERALHAGDVVEFWTNRGHFTAPLAHDAAANSTVSLDVDQHTSKGDRIFRVRNAQSAFQDDPFEPRIPVHGRIELHLGAPARMTFEARGLSCSVLGNVVEPARTKALSAGEVATHVDRLGQTPFVLADALDVRLDEGVGMSFSHIHQLRARCLDELQHALLDAYNAQRETPERLQRAKLRHELSEALMAQVPPTPTVPVSVQKQAASAHTAQAASPLSVCAWASNPSCARLARKAGADHLYVPALNYRRNTAQLAGATLNAPEQAGYPSGCTPAMPTINHDPIAPASEATLGFDVWDYVQPGKPVFVDSLSDAWRALTLGAVVEVGSHVPLTNKASLAFVARLGVRRVWLSPELTLGQIAELAEDAKDMPLELGLTVSGAQELMITQHCLLMSQGDCAQNCATCARRAVRHHFVDRKGFEFPLVTDVLGRTHLYNGAELDATGVMADLFACGISSVMVDTTLLNKEQTAREVRRVVRARDLAVGQRRSVEKRPGTTTGHLFRGVI